MSRLSWIKKALEVGVVTRKYPFEHAEVPEGYRGLPEFDPSKCIGCTACANVCTPDAITVIDDPVEGVRRLEYFVGRCVFCGRCADVCPASAIRITKEFELASKDEVRFVIELKLIKCSICGKPFTTTRHLSTVSGKVGEELHELTTLCPECRRLLIINSFTNSLGGKI